MSLRDILFLWGIVLLIAWPLSAHADITTDLQVDWSFNDGTGTSAADSSGNGNTGTIDTYSGASSTWVSGVIGSYALSINGTDTQVQLPSSISLGTSYTYAAWIYLEGVSGDGEGTLFSQDDFNGMEILLSSGSYYLNDYQYSGGPGEIGQSVGTIPLNTWTHVVGVCNAGTWSFYINGVLDSTYSGCVAESFLELADDEPGANEGFQGSVDDARVYNRALDDADVAQLYNYTGPNSLIDWWKFDEGSGTTANDSSGNGHTGTLENSPTWTTGVNGDALTFNGTNQYVDSSNFADNLPNFTVSAWFKVPSGASQGAGCGGAIVSKIDSGGILSGAGWIIALTNGSDCGLGTNFVTGFIQESGGSYYNGEATTATYNDGNWHHVAMVVSGGAAILYVDGSNSGMTTYGGGDVSPYSTPTYVMVGNDGANEYFNGTVDDVHIYNSALSATDVYQLYKSTGPNALIARWKFDEGTGSTAYDAGPVGYNGTLATTGSNLPSWVAGRYGDALSFDGSTNYVDADNFADNLSNFTVACWFKTTTTPGGWGSQIVGDLNSGGLNSGTGWYISFDGPDNGSNTIAAWIVTDGSDWVGQISSASTYNDGKWHQAVMVVTGGNTVKLYMDGIAAGNTYTSGAMGTYLSLADVRVAYDYGGDPDGTDFFTGTVDDVRIYNYALTPGQVYELFESSSQTYTGTEF